ncbi:site-specific integrase [Streptomyces inhibens]|uniref:site-specific integrase n=1 Tax=Streptomyces inhibens TaxID=2293571 RepID=UPI001EE73D19|nr:site-specific integrase [Streptomyces inhibens]UKY54945.1 site-specific integrase [Streptomyces inhibens]
MSARVQGPVGEAVRAGEAGLLLPGAPGADRDLKDYWTFLARRGLDWREVRLEDLGEYVVWLQLPPSGRKGQIAVLPSVEPHVSASTVNRKLSALSAFYAHQLRHGVSMVLCWRGAAPGRWEHGEHQHDLGAGAAVNANARYPVVLV